MRTFWERAERLLTRAACSPWASAANALYLLCWMLSEAHRGKAIGWDGVQSWLALEVGLAVLRRRADGERE